MKRRTRNYARRQLTWLRKLTAVQVVDTTDRSPVAIADDVCARWLRTPQRTDT
jgi:tRNA dimethylallyltransferase